MPTIKQLPTSVINKIAAGEVIERPASVVKELLENSVDAGATRIEVVIEKGGQDLMRITDNGHGISSDQLELAVTSHATSKISDADDLFQVTTMGFRGEALASIAEVSQMVMRSRTADAQAGFELRINGGQREPVHPCSCGVGTSIDVRNLFFNTPVRRRFLKTTQTEMGHITEAFARVALARPEIHMTLQHNERTIHELPATENWSQRINTFFGPDIGGALIPIASGDNDIRISGFVVDPTHSRGNNRLQYLFLNGRYIRDRALQHALREAYRGLLMTGRFPIAFLNLQMPAELVDVNVHPAKLEVRFQEGSRLYSQLLGALRNKFLSTDLTARAQLSAPAEPAAAAMPSTPAMSQSTMTLPVERARQDWTSLPDFKPFPGDRSQSLGSGTSNDFRPVSADADPSGFPTPSGNFDSPTTTSSAHTDSDSFPIPVDDRAPVARALQIHDRYLITESAEGVVVIDQHALHERIIYEQLREKVLAGKLESQQLLVPEPVPLTPAEAAKVLQSQQVLGQIGINVQEFGGDTVLVSSYPAMLANHNPADMLRGVVDILLQEGKALDARDVVDELLHMISCKAAIKAGDKLSDAEIASLLENRQLCQDAHHCPHGRPTALVFSREELDRRFKRI